MAEVRADLDAAGFEGARVQSFGSTSQVLIRLPPLGETANSEQVRDQLFGILSARHPDVTL